MSSNGFEYEWGDAKDLANQAKHNVSFDLAKSVFEDIHALVKHDRTVGKEQREVIVGTCSDGRVITVAFTRRDGKIRIISANERRKEKQFYEKAKAEKKDQN